MEREESFLDKPLGSSLTLVLLLIIVFAVWYLLPGFMSNTDLPVSQRGAYGDSFGSVNSLFTGLAFAGLVFTILLQQREIKLQRLDFMSQVEEMQKSRQELEQQNKLSQMQIALTINELKMKPLEAEIKLCELKAHQWTAGAMGQNAEPLFRKVQKQMNEIIADSLKQIE